MFGRFPFWRGHLRTIAPFLSRRLRPLARPQTVPVAFDFDEPEVGQVRLTGALLKKGSRDLLVVLHGLGGSIESGYMACALRAADEAGRDCLLLNFRGADCSRVDVYHSGLTSDLERVLQSDLLKRYEAIDLFGYSIGGHVALCYATRQVDARLRRVAAICSPLDLERSARDFDRARLSLYRGHVMGALRKMYPHPSVSLELPRLPGPYRLTRQQVRAIDKIEQWDRLVVAPRFGFASPKDYYRSQSVAQKLDQLRVESLYVGARFDPMVQAEPVRSALEHAPIESVWDDAAGHLGFRDDFQLGLAAPSGLEPQVLAWLSRP